MREYEVVERVETYMKKKKFKTYREVPALDKKIDIVGVRNREIWAVEAKVKDWKRALQQAVTDRLFVDRVYVALWHEFAGRADEEIYGKFGIGIMSVDGSVEIIKPAKKSKIAHASLVKKLTDGLRGENGKN